MVIPAAPHRSLGSTGPRSRARGFSFIEIMIVLAIIAVLAGLGIGFMQNLGQGTRLLQARSIVLETAFACKATSNGDTRATFTMRKSSTEGDRVLVEALAARSVLTANFETLDFVSLGYPIRAENGAQIDPDLTQGFVGHALKLQRGAYLELPAQAAFATTEGLAIDLHVRTEGGGAQMVLLQGTDPEDERNAIYTLALVKASDGSGYEVRLTLLLRLRDAAATTGTRTDFTTAGAPVRGDGTWQRIQAHFDGRDASIRVNGLERLRSASVAAKPARPGPGGPAGSTTPAAASDVTKRLVVPTSGTVKLLVSSPSAPFVGWIDALVLGGMFRSSEFSRELFGDLDVKQPPLPVRAEFVNGRLDPQVHRSPVVIVMADRAKPESIPWTITLGLDGEITAVEGLPPKGEAK